MKKYKWVAESNCRSWQDESSREFTSKEECYNDMRNAALKKMKWNTEFYDVENKDKVAYKVNFSENKIIHESYSGIYTYEIKEYDDKTFKFTSEQVSAIVHALKTNIRVNQESIDIMYDVCGKNEYTKETAKNIINGNICLRTLLNYIEQV